MPRPKPTSNRVGFGNALRDSVVQRQNKRSAAPLASFQNIPELRFRCIFFSGIVLWASKKAHKLDFDGARLNLVLHGHEDGGAIQSEFDSSFGSGRRFTSLQ